MNTISLVQSKETDRVVDGKVRAEEQQRGRIARKLQTECADGEETLPRLYISLKGNSEIPPDDLDVQLHKN